MVRPFLMSVWVGAYSTVRRTALLPARTRYTPAGSPAGSNEDSAYKRKLGRAWATAAGPAYKVLHGV